MLLKVIIFGFFSIRLRRLYLLLLSKAWWSLKGGAGSLIKKYSELKNFYRTYKYYDNANGLRCLEREIDDLLHEEELYKKQRTHVSWLKEGDKNTQFFHSYASMWRLQNLIRGLLNQEGQLVTDMAGMGIIVEQYFTQLFSSSNPINQ